MAASGLNINYTQANSEEEFAQILRLQQLNLPVHLSAQEQQKEGFVTVKHDLELLKKMNARFPHTLAKYRDNVIGYALSMTSDLAEEITVLQPLFDQLEQLDFKNDSFLVMGQVCIARDYRQQGIFRDLYTAMGNFASAKYKSIITEVDQRNVRSLDAHLAVGFRVLKEYKEKKHNWVLLILDLSHQ